MALETFEPLIVRVFGGLCTFIDRLSLGLGLSPNCRNVQFFPGTVGSRYGYETFTQYGGTAITAASPIYSFKPFISRKGLKQIVYLTSYGATTGTLSVRTHYPISTTDLLTGLGTSRINTLKADALFGRLYIAVQDGGLAISSGGTEWGRTRALAFDGASLKEIAPDGPAWVPDVAPYAASVGVSAGTGLSVGTHMATWLFLMKNGYITRPGTGTAFTVAAAGTAVLTVVNAPIGPPDTAARILALTAADDTNFYYVPGKTVIWDNTTKDFTQAVTDSDLLNGEPVRPYFDLYTPSAPAGIIAYSDRLVMWGCVEKAELSTKVYPTYGTVGLPNLSFNGGFQTATNRYYSAPYALPSFWQSTVPSFTGFGPGSGGDTLKITGAATTSDDAYVEKVFNESYIRPGQNLALRIRARWSGAMATGRVSVVLTLTDTAGATALTITRNLDINTMSTEWIIQETGGTVVPALGKPPLSAVLAKLRIRCAVVFPQPTDWMEIDWVEIIDLDDTSQQNVLRVSRAGEPEAFDIKTGFISVGPDDGEGIRNCFRLRDALYICKERSLYVTKDIGEEPISWPVDLVDRLSGTPSPHGVANGDGWVAIASRVGLVLFDGATPQIISQEITPTWDSIDWTDPSFVWVVADPARKQIKVGARTSSTTTDPCQLLLTLDYTEGFGNPIPSGVGRKWSIDCVMSKGYDSLVTPSKQASYHQGNMLVDIYGTPRPVYSMSSTVPAPPGADVEVHTLTYQDVARNDFPHATTAGEGNIDAIYETAPLGPEIGRGLFDKVVHRVRGSGTLATYYVRPTGAVATKPDGSSPALAQASLTSAPEHDIELGGNQQDTSVGIRIQTFSASDWFSLRRLAVFLKNATYNWLRGHNL